MNFNLQDWVTYASARVYGLEKAILGIGYAFMSGQNMIFHGPPGYAKSYIGELFGHYLRDTNQISTGVFIKSLHGGTTEDDLFGGIDMKTFKDSGEIVHLLAKSFASYEYVVLEEFGDAYIGALTALKDCLTSGFVRVGAEGTWYPVKTKMILANTNKDRKSMIRDLTTAAIFERLPMDCEVTWGSHDYDDYYNLLKMVAPGAPEYNRRFVAKLVDLTIANKKINPSPRTATTALDAMNRCGTYKVLAYYAEMGEYVDSVHEQLVALQKRDLVTTIQTHCNRVIEDLVSLPADFDIALDVARASLNVLFRSLICLKKNDTKLGDDVFDVANATMDSCKKSALETIRDLQARIGDSAKSDSVEKLIKDLSPANVSNYINLKAKSEPHVLDALTEGFSLDEELHHTLNAIEAL